MKQLKVCLITDTWFPVIGGGPQVVWNYAKKLTINHNCKVDIITRRFNQQDNYHLEKISNLKIIKFGPSLAWNDIFARLLFIVKTFLHLLSNNYDVVHAFPFVSGLSAWLYGLLSKKPVIFSVFALKSQKKGRPLIDIEEILENFLTFSLSYKLLITDNKEILEKHKNKNIIYIPNGVDIESFDKVKINKDTFPRLLFVGRFHKQKGIHILLKVIEPLTKYFPSLKLILVGYGDQEKVIKELINRHKINGYVEIKTPLYGDDLIKEYKKSHVLVLPSLYEGQGIVVFEAWAAKLPVVVSQVGNLKYIVKEGINGYLVKPNKSTDLFSKILKVLKNQKRDSMGLAGYKLVKKEYTWDKVVNKLIRQYRHV